jgi:hypothetical protein
MSSHFLYRNVNIKVYSLLFYLLFCMVWSFASHTEGNIYTYILRVYENRVLRRISGPNMRQQEAGRNWIIRSFIICIAHKILLKWTNRGELDGRDIYVAWDRWEIHTKFWSENLRQLGRPRRRWKFNIKRDLKEGEWKSMNWIHGIMIGSSGKAFWKL